MSTTIFASSADVPQQYSPPSVTPAPRNERYLWLKATLCIWMGCLLLVCIATYHRPVEIFPSATAALGIDRCDTTPCFRGLIPGETSWTKALETVGPLQDGDHAPTDLKITLGQSSDHSTLDAISLDVPPETTLTASDIIRLYGAPCSVYLYSRSNTSWNTITLRFPGLHVQTDIIQERLSLDSPVRHLFFTRSVGNFTLASPGRCRNEPQFASDVTVNRWNSWRGFASLDHYLN